MYLQTVLYLQASLFFFLGTVVLLAHQTSRTPDSDASVRWFFAASSAGAIGLMLQAWRGYLPAWLAIIVGNMLFMLLVIFITRAIALAIDTSSRVIPYQVGTAVVTVAALAYYTFVVPDVTRRVFIVSLISPALLIPATVMLLSSQQRSLQAATRTLAGIFVTYICACLFGAVRILKGEHPTSGASWAGAILIGGVALCFLWMDLLRMRAELERQATTDPLTGLPNRRALEEFCTRELDRNMRKLTSLSVLTVDVDYFKSINDGHGHMTGDLALLAISSVLRKNIRAHDMAARVGGDEFVVVLTDSSFETANRIIGRIHLEVSHLTLKSHEGKPFVVSVTVGCFTTSPRVETAYGDVIHASDTDLYRKKQQRKTSNAGLQTAGAPRAQNVDDSVLK